MTRAAMLAALTVCIAAQAARAEYALDGALCAVDDHPAEIATAGSR